MQWHTNGNGPQTTVHWAIWYTSVSFSKIDRHLLVPDHLALYLTQTATGITY